MQPQKIFIQVYDVDGVSLATSTDVISASGQFTLNRIGSGSFRVPASSAIAEHLEIANHVWIWTQNVTGGGNNWLIQQIIISDVSQVDDENGKFIDVRGESAESLLNFRRTGTNTFDSDIAPVLPAIMDFAPLFTYEVTGAATAPSLPIYLVSANHSVFELLRQAAEQTGDSFYIDGNAQKVWWYGDTVSSGITFSISSENAPIISIRRQIQGESPITKLKAFGAGTGVDALRLDTVPLTNEDKAALEAQFPGISWSPQMYLWKSSLEITGYSLKDGEIRFPYIRPRAEVEGEVGYDADAELYKAVYMLNQTAGSYFHSLTVSRTLYEVKSIVSNYSIQVGATARLTYNNVIELEPGEYRVDEDLFILSVHHNIGEDGIRYSTITLSDSIDEWLDPNQKIVKKLAEQTETNRATSSPPSEMVPVTPVHHHSLLGLDDDDHPQYLRADGGTPLVGNLVVGGTYTLDGVDLSAHAANAAAHHNPVTVGDGLSLTTQQVSLTTPGSLTAASTNNPASNHTHAIDSTIARSAITITAGDGLTGGGNLTANRTLSLTTPGTLTVATANNAAGSHTHAITSSSNPGAAAALLATNASGYLQLNRLGIGVAPTAKLNIDATGAAVAGIVVKTDLYQNLFQYQKPDGTNLLRAMWDTGNMHHYLGGTIQYNMSGNSFVIDGNGNAGTMLRLAGSARFALDDAPVPTTNLIAAGQLSYATAVAQLSAIQPVLIQTHAWNGSNGNSIYSFSSLKQTQLSTTIGDARLDIRNTASTAVLSLKLLSGNVGINTTAPEEMLDVNGNLQMRGNIIPRTTAAHDLGSVTKFWNKEYVGELWSSVLVGSTPYVSRTTGWQVNAAGDGDFRNLFVDQLEAQTFIVDNVLATAGTDILTKSLSTLSRDFTVAASATLYVYDLPGTPDTPVFNNADWIRLRYISMATGLIIEDIYGTVSSYTNLADGEQSWTFTKQSGTDGRVIYAGATALDYGASGDGFILSTVADTYSPYTDVRTWATTPDNDTTHLRMGQLQGITAVDEYGIVAKISNLQQLIASDGRLELHGAKFSLYSGGTEVIRLDPAVPSLAMGATLPAYGGTGVWMGLHSGAYKFRAGDASDYVQWDGTLLTVAGKLLIDGSSEFVGVATLGTSGGIYQGTGTFASPTTGLKIFNSGGVGRIAGYNAGVEQVGFATDGKLKAGAGTIVIDAAGMSMNNAGQAISFTQDGSLNASIGLSGPDLRLLSHGAAGSNLTSDSSFESGLGGWTGGSVTWSTAQAYTGTHSILIYLENAPATEDYAQSPSYSIAGGSALVKFSLFIGTKSPSNVPFDCVVSWNNGGGDVSVLQYGYSTTATGWLQIAAVLAKPAGSTAMTIKPIVYGITPLGYIYLYVDDVTVQSLTGSGYAQLRLDSSQSAQLTSSVGLSLSAPSIALTGATSINGNLKLWNGLAVGNPTATVVDDAIGLYYGSTKMGEFTTMDSTWFRINQDVAKNIYSPRVFVAEGGFSTYAASMPAGGVLYTGSLVSRKASVDHTGFIYVPYTTKKTSTSWDGDTKTAANNGTLDLSALFAIPANAKAVYVRLSAQSATINQQVGVGPSSSEINYVMCRTQVANQYTDAFGIVNCDANGDIYITIEGTNNIRLEIFGYFI